MVGLSFQNELIKILVAIFVVRGNNQNTSAGFALHNSVLVFFFFFPRAVQRLRSTTGAAQI